jgi:hypothetical protein
LNFHLFPLGKILSLADCGPDLSLEFDLSSGVDIFDMDQLKAYFPITNER